MPIVYPISLPAAPRPRRVSLTMRNVVGANRSPFTQQGQHYEWPGQLWLAQVELQIMSRAAAAAWIAAMAKLKGMAGTFLLGDPGAEAPRGSASGNPVVDGAGQSGEDLATRGWTPGAQGVLLEGDYIQLGAGASARLHMVLADANADGAGDAVFSIWPSLRSAPANGAAVVTSAAKGVFRLAANDNPFDRLPPEKATVSFQAVEDL